MAEARQAMKIVLGTSFDILKVEAAEAARSQNA